MEGELLEMNGKMHLIKSKLVIFCQFSTKIFFYIEVDNIYFIPCYSF
jgi:hypothetical protein